MKKHLIFLLLLATGSTLYPWIDHNGVPQEGFGGYRGFWNRLDDLKNGNLFRDSNAQAAINKGNPEDIKNYVKAPDFGRHPELLLKLIESNCPEAWEYINGLKDLDGAEFDPINTLIHYFDRLIEGGYEPELALEKLIAKFGDDALLVFKQINSRIDSDNPQHQELRKKLFNPRENGPTLLHAAVDAGAHGIVRESLENESYSDDAIDVSLKDNDGRTISALIAAKKHFLCDEDEHMGSPLSVEEGRMRKKECPHWKTTHALMQRKLRNQRIKSLQEADKEKSTQRDAEKQKEEARLDQALRENEEKVQALLDEQELTKATKDEILAELKKKQEQDEANLQELLELYCDDID